MDSSKSQGHTGQAGATDTSAEAAGVAEVAGPANTKSLEVRYLPNGRLSVRNDGEVTPVSVCLCFPFSQPQCYVSLRDGKNNEVAMITELSELDDRSREVVEQGLVEAGFVFEIEKIESLKTEFEIRVWKVMTRQGGRMFQTELDEYPRPLGDGSLLISDVAGCLYHIADAKALDQGSQKLLWAFVD